MSLSRALQLVLDEQFGVLIAGSARLQRLVQLDSSASSITSPRSDDRASTDSWLGAHSVPLGGGVVGDVLDAERRADF